MRAGRRQVEFEGRTTNQRTRSRIRRNRRRVQRAQVLLMKRGATPSEAATKRPTM